MVLQGNDVSTTPSPPQPKQRVGVADYFAILGVGKELIWKHAQKQQPATTTTAATSATTASSDSKPHQHQQQQQQQQSPSQQEQQLPSGALAEEDDARLMERFYREIVDCTIWVADETTEHATNLPTTLVYTTTATNSNTTTSNNSGGTPGATFQTQQRPYPVVLPSSPVPSDVGSTAMPATAPTTMTTITTTTAATSTAIEAEIETVELGGWSIIQQTRPMSAPSPHFETTDDNNNNNNNDSYDEPSNSLSYLWTRGQVWEANLDPIRGLSGEILQLYHKMEQQKKEQQQKSERRRKSSVPSVPLKDLREKVQATFQQRLVQYSTHRNPNGGRKTKYYLTFRRRAPDESHRPAIADIQLLYVKLHKSTLDLPSHPLYNNHPHRDDSDTATTTTAAPSVAASSTVSAKGAAALLRVAEVGKQTFQSRVLGTPATQKQQPHSATIPLSAQASMDCGEQVPLDSLLKLPSGFDEWSIPATFQNLRFPSRPPTSDTPFQTVLYTPSTSEPDMDSSSPGIEAVQRHVSSPTNMMQWQETLKPRLIPAHSLNETSFQEEEEYTLVPILAIRRQRIGEEERFHEDPALVEIAVTFMDHYGKPVLPYKEVDPFEEEDEDVGLTLLEKTDWALASASVATNKRGMPPNNTESLMPGKACLLVRRNMPLGFCDAAFTTSVLDRFPYKNYKGLPLPEEELPMFCYPTGCRLHRAKFCDAPLPQYYGFVVKNERGDSIYVSCVSFMEPLTRQKRAQLARLSEKRRRVSLPHAMFWARRQRRMRKRQGYEDQSDTTSNPMDWFQDVAEEDARDDQDDDDDDDESDLIYTGFEEMTTFENKTICLVSRYPYWSAFRRFLSHLHNASGSSSDLPIERYISHLLLEVPIPKPGGPSILIPLPTFSIPMMLWTPPLKDLPLLDLPYERLVSCLDIPTIVTIVLGFLALEQKVIVMSTRPSLVLDVCELLRSLLFPFELCAPYVPRLTEPFMSCLDFPGAIFVGIHNDGSPTGLAAVVRENMPEDSTIVDLDSGSVDCSGDRLTVLNNSWGLIPQGPRSVLVSEIETLCRDAGIVPGQEPLDSLVDPVFEATMPSSPVQDVAPLKNQDKEPLDDRAVRDAFLRFFCSVLGGYERFLVVPDVDFLISGNEWFDSKGFLASAPPDKAAYLGPLVATQLFQSFIQRRTEASDVHCLLFDECLAEFHSAPLPYGRLGGDVETLQPSGTEQPQLLYSLLVDQSATEANLSFANERSFDVESRPGSDIDSSGHLPQVLFGNTENGDGVQTLPRLTKNETGDWVAVPSHQGLPNDSRFVYCVDGNPTFPDRLNPNSYLPRQPESWLVEMNTAPTPMLTRSEKEIEEADRRRKLATTFRGLQTQRRCKWQLPKLMGSHFLGAYLLCTPALVSVPFLTREQQSKYLLRALGVLRFLRTKQRIVPDEAAYRALIVACGRTKNDRRLELVKLFGLLRSDGIFPSAVTLGQYTKALAEGYSKQRATGPADEESGSIDKSDAAGAERQLYNAFGNQNDPEVALASLDRNLATLEDTGRRWRQKSSSEMESGAGLEEAVALPESKASDRNRKKGSKPWLPVVFSSSFAPTKFDENGTATTTEPFSPDSIFFMALWSRTKACESCGYIPLEEEVQAGWDVLGGENDIPGAINCTRCGAMLIPKLGYKRLTLREAISTPTADPTSPSAPDGSATSDFSTLPPQLRPTIDQVDGNYVTYVSPATLRSSLERHIEEHGEEILERDKLRSHDPEVFYNLWWYCARYSLPLPLPVSTNDDRNHYWAMAAWDHQVALRGCWSAATVLTSLFNKTQPPNDVTTTVESLGDNPLLARFNLQGHYSTVWDHSELSEVLVALVEACDKRDFRPVVECLLRANKRRIEKYGGPSSMVSSSQANSDDGGNEYTSGLQTTRSDLDTSTSGVSVQNVELEGYRTALYLAKYQCTSAFHAFFPTTLRPCKGYHFWCPVAPLPIFDRLLHEAINRVRAKSTSYEPFHDVSEVALGFRCVFGHLM